MRGGGRGRGRGGRGGRYLDDGLPRQAPITEAPLNYPLNPRLPVYKEDADTPKKLTLDEQTLVAINRILVNHWRSESFFHVSPEVKRPVVETFSNSSVAVLDPKTQKEAIVKLSGPEYFPAELLAETFRGPKHLDLGGGRGTRKQQLNRVVEKENGKDVGENDDDEPEAAEEDEDFGGEDYAHDHYADEDKDDSDNDAGGGGDDEF